jgi:hypothetical protein
VRQWRLRRPLSRHLHLLHSSTAIRCRSSSFARGDPELVALVREAEDSEAKGGLVAAGGGRKGKRAEYRCAACGYGIVVYGRPSGCPMCSEARWEHVAWPPFSRLLDDLALPFGTQSRRRRLQAPSSPTAEEPIRYLRPGQAGASPEK